MPNSGLTPEQRALVAEVSELLSSLNLDPDELASLENSEERTTRLEMAKRQLINSAVVFDYVLMDEYLSCIMAWFFFGTKESFMDLWKTTRFQVFNYQLLEKMYLVQKLDFVKAIHGIPKEVASDLMALNDLRNGIAHSFFPENRKRRPLWNNKDIYSKEGFTKFREDMTTLRHFFMERFFKETPEVDAETPAAELG